MSRKRSGIVVTIDARMSFDSHLGQRVRYPLNKTEGGNSQVSSASVPKTTKPIARSIFVCERTIAQGKNGMTLFAMPHYAPPEPGCLLQSPLSRELTHIASLIPVFSALF
jgi:hypothetical protein